MRVYGSLFTGAFLLAATAAAPAQPGYIEPDPQQAIADSGFQQNYVGLRGSYAFNGNNLTTYTPTSPSAALHGSLGSGGGGSLYFGTRLPLNLRLEVEALYRTQSLSNASLAGVPFSASGRQYYAAPMMNLLWDLPMPADSLLQPFVGMGAGAAYTDTAFNDGAGNTLKSSKWNLAYSFIAGLAMPLSDSSRVTAMYRWMQVRDADFRCSAGGFAGRCLDTNLNSSAVDIGYEMDL